MRHQKNSTKDLVANFANLCEKRQKGTIEIGTFYTRFYVLLKNKISNDPMPLIDCLECVHVLPQLMKEYGIKNIFEHTAVVSYVWWLSKGEYFDEYFDDYKCVQQKRKKSNYPHWAKYPVTIKLIMSGILAMLWDIFEILLNKSLLQKLIEKIIERW